MKPNESGEAVRMGQHVTVVDELGVRHDGLVTANWGSHVPGCTSTCINVVYVSSDMAKHDCYGQQKEHMSSCSHATMTTAPGRYWYVDPKHARDTERCGFTMYEVAYGEDQRRQREAHEEWQKKQRERLEAEAAIK